MNSRTILPREVHDSCGPLNGQVVDEVLSRGKHLFIRVGRASIHSHLKMDGAWIIGRVRAPAYKIRIVLGTARKASCDARMTIGRITSVKVSAPANTPAPICIPRTKSPSPKMP